MMQQIKNKTDVALSDFLMPYSVYPVCNYLRYGFSNETFKLYWTDGGALIAQYDDSLTICSKIITEQDCINLKDFIIKNKIRMLSGSMENVHYFHSFFNEGVIEDGNIVSLLPLFGNENKNIKCATTIEEYKKIAKLVLNVNKSNVSYYKYDQYLKQIYSRYLNKYCRNLYIEKKEGFIGHIATYAESKSIAVLGGLVIREDCRGQGLATQLFESLLNMLSSENKKSYLFCYNDSLLHFYKRYSDLIVPCSKILYSF